MGIFTYVKVDDSILPDRLKGMGLWQTYDVVEPDMGTLEITADGQLYYTGYDRKWVEAGPDDSPYGGYWSFIERAKEKINYTGVMWFCNTIVCEFYDLKAVFKDGKLVNTNIEVPEWL